MSSSATDAGGDAAELEAAARAASVAAQRLLDKSATREISDAAVQQLVGAAARLFARKVEEERRYFSPLTSPTAATPTEAATLITELLRAVDLNLFDLSMWAGRPRDGADQSGTGIVGT